MVTLMESKNKIYLIFYIIFLTACGGGSGSKDKNPDNPTSIVASTHFFVGNDGVNGSELWKTDGTEQGTVMVKDINPEGDSRPGQLTYNNGVLYFNADDGVHGRELWTSDGTENGTVIIKDVNPNGDSVTFFTSINGSLYLYMTDGINGYELWKSDGSAEGTVMVMDIGPVGLSGFDHYSLTHIGDTLYFSGYAEVARCALWRSDGTESGTFSVREFNPSQGASCPARLTNVNGELFFSASDEAFGAELWKSDGTRSGTVMVKDINMFLIAGSRPANFVSFDDKLYFTAEDEDHGRELWVSNGTEAGTTIVADINPGESGSSVGMVTPFREKLFFDTGGPCNTGIWVSDGTENGTYRFGSCGHPLFKWVVLNQPTIINNTLYFFSNNDFGDDLWQSDSTTQGTFPVTNFSNNPGLSFAIASYNRNYKSLVFPDGRFLMGAEDEINGRELWVTDGTEQGTMMVKDVNPGSANGFSW